ncbi:hypothetical protein BV898_08259 [Hypsibius exemplaris]|uniref:Zinc finger PHD-type domain-containing protein n=1 Tax=Hypsibius exemplaris TaxID=2072580 RepID=A0A1W0WQZ9_HYPEX|nr:hypothetical protein BV898_08259 [Hypsibius exemplaris]
MMGEPDTGSRDRDENQPNHEANGNSNTEKKYRIPLNSSISLLSISGGGSSCGDSSNSSSKSNSPDHVVPRTADESVLVGGGKGKGKTSPPQQQQQQQQHRLSTSSFSSSSAASSPQTDGSIITGERYVGHNHHPDVVHRGIQGGGSSGEGRSVVLEVEEDRNSSSVPCRTAASGSAGGKDKPRKLKPGRKPSSTSPEKRIPSSSKKKPRKQQQQLGKSQEVGTIRIKREQPEEEENAANEESDYVIRCICGYGDILGEQIQCEKCEVWQHFACMGVQPAAVPDSYLCEVCDPSVVRPLCAEEAREVHKALLIADANSAEARSRRKAKRVSHHQRKSSDVLSPLVPPRQTDLISSSDKRRQQQPDASGCSSSRTSMERGGSTARQSQQRDDMTTATTVTVVAAAAEMSRDDRKILQYEQMFQRMEDRRNKKVGRRSTTKQQRNSNNPAEADGSSNGSPSRDISARDREEESHEDSTNPPPSPPNANMAIFSRPTPPAVAPPPTPPPAPTPAPAPAPVVAASIPAPPIMVIDSHHHHHLHQPPPPVFAATVFVPPKGFTVPSSTSTMKDSLPARMRKVRRSKEEKAAKARKESSSASESDSATAIVDKTDKNKARYSMRLRNVTKPVELSPINSKEDSRIELNCMKNLKKREEGDGGQDDDLMNTASTSSMMPAKRRLRTASFVDTYYSAMADLQTESELQKANRRNRAYSASQEWERVKVEQERSRLYHLYGLKKAVCARFNDEPIDKLVAASASPSPPVEPSLSTPSTHKSIVLRFTTKPDGPSRLSGPANGLSSSSTTTKITIKRLSSPETQVATAVKRSRTVRAMIEDSMRKNAEYERYHQAGAQRIAVAHPPAFHLPVTTTPVTTPTRPPITAAEIISAATALRSDVFGKTVGGLGNVLSVKDSMVVKIPPATNEEVTAFASADLADFIGARSIAIPGGSLAAIEDVLPVGTTRNCSEPTTPTTPKKLSLAEYKQRKLTLQASGGENSPTISVPIPTPPVSPAKTILHPPTIPPTTAPSAKATVDPASIVVGPSLKLSSPSPSTTIATLTAPQLPATAVPAPPTSLSSSSSSSTTPSRITSVIQRVGKSAVVPPVEHHPQHHHHSATAEKSEKSGKSSSSHPSSSSSSSGALPVIGRPSSSISGRSSSVSGSRRGDFTVSSSSSHHHHRNSQEHIPHGHSQHRSSSSSNRHHHHQSSRPSSSSNRDAHPSSSSSKTSSSSSSRSRLPAGDHHHNHHHRRHQPSLSSSSTATTTAIAASSSFSSQKFRPSQQLPRSFVVEDLTT